MLFRSADALDRLLTDEALRSQLVARGHERVATFSWAATAGALASCYDQLAERGS